MKEKIGIAIITFNRQEFFEKVQASIPDYVSLYVVNTGSKYPQSIYQDRVKLHQCDKKTCVGWGKNHALRMMINDGCDHLFTMEDDVIITNPDVCKKYIKAASVSGIWHMNFGYHGPANFKPNQYGIPNPKQIIDYGNGVEIAFNQHCVGAFSYYYKGVIKHIGYIDERFINAWDHIEHTYRIIRNRLHPPFWWFADIADSMNYIKELASSTENTTIERTPEWLHNFKSGAEYFKRQYGCYPTQINDTPPELALKLIENLQKNYSREIEL